MRFQSKRVWSTGLEDLEHWENFKKRKFQYAVKKVLTTAGKKWKVLPFNGKQFLR